MDELKRFRQLGSRTPGHPEYGHAPGIETTTGPLGQGLGNAVGMALAERLLNRRYGDEIVNHFTYCVAGDGCLMEGISHEAISLAGHLKLGRLIVLFDDNQISIDGPTSLAVSDDQIERFKASGWHTARVNGHDPEAVALAIENAQAVTDRPSLIACRTVIGYGAPSKAGTAATHGSPLGEEEIKGAREKLHWRHQPFEVPKPILASWRAAGTRHRAAYESLGASRQAARCVGARKPHRSDRRQGQSCDRRRHRRAQSRTSPARMPSWRRGNPRRRCSRSCCRSSRASSAARPTSPAPTARSPRRSVVIKPGDFVGNYIHYGVREHGMAAAMNGLALHGGIVPYGGTFLVFSDYCRPAIRLSALMQQRVIYVMTHDSIGLGEDGPTHQPVEHLAALRAIPNLYVMRPADSIECAECWELALLAKHTPTILALTRQGVPVLRTTHTDENLSAKGGYVLIEPKGKRDVTLIGTGSELALAVEAAKALDRRGDRRRRRLHAVLRAVRGASRELPERCPGFGPARRGRGRGRVRLGEMARA